MDRGFLAGRPPALGAATSDLWHNRGRARRVVQKRVVDQAQLQARVAVSSACADDTATRVRVRRRVQQRPAGRGVDQPACHCGLTARLCRFAQRVGREDAGEPSVCTTPGAETPLDGRVGGSRRAPPPVGNAAPGPPGKRTARPCRCLALLDTNGDRTVTIEPGETCVLVVPAN